MKPKAMQIVDLFVGRKWSNKNMSFLKRNGLIGVEKEPEIDGK